MRDTTSKDKTHRISGKPEKEEMKNCGKAPKRHRKLMLNPNQRRFMKKKERLIMSRKMKELRE